MQKLCLSHSPAIRPSLLQRAPEEPQKLQRLGVVTQPALDVPLGVLPGAERPADGVDPEVAVDAPPDLGDAEHGLEAWTAVTHRFLFSAHGNLRLGAPGRAATTQAGSAGRSAWLTSLPKLWMVTIGARRVPFRQRSLTQMSPPDNERDARVRYLDIPPRVAGLRVLRPSCTSSPSDFVVQNRRALPGAQTRRPAEPHPRERRRRRPRMEPGPRQTGPQSAARHATPLPSRPPPGAPLSQGRHIANLTQISRDRYTCVPTTGVRLQRARCALSY